MTNSKENLKSIFKKLDDPEIVNMINAPQFEYSEQLLDIEFNNSFTQEEMAERAGISLQDFLDFEIGSTKHSIDEYRSVIDHIEKTLIDNEEYIELSYINLEKPNAYVNLFSLVNAKTHRTSMSLKLQQNNNSRQAENQYETNSQFQNANGSLALGVNWDDDVVPDSFINETSRILSLNHSSIDDIDEEEKIYV
ncbi:MAG: hypothetical protein ABF967_11510 [Lacticaseibacillus paracasei]